MFRTDGWTKQVIEDITLDSRKLYDHFKLLIDQRYNWLIANINNRFIDDENNRNV